MNKVLVAAVSAVALVAAAGCASHRGETQGTNRTAGAVIDDSALTARVKTALATDIGACTSVNVNVTTYKGQVQLSGFVDSQDKAAKAAETARKVSGVQSVKNDIQVKSAAAGK